MKKELQRIKASKDELFIHPHYDGKKITTVVQGRQGIHLESIDLHNGTREKITAPVWYELDNPVVQDSLLLFRASFNANNSFYARNSRTGHIDNVLNAPYGVRFPSLYTDSLYFSFYTSDGYKPGRIALKDLKNIPLDKEHFRLADSLVRRENWKMSWDNDSIYPTRKYRKLTHLFNFHSWGPLYIDPSRQEITAGIVAYSQNKLSTLSLSADIFWIRTTITAPGCLTPATKEYGRYSPSTSVAEDTTITPSTQRPKTCTPEQKIPST